LSPASLTEGGLWIGSEPLVRLDSASTEREELGRRLLEALDNSKVGVPHPSRNEWDAVAKPLLALAGVSTWEQFEAGAKLCEIERSGGVIRLIPTINHGGEDGFKLDKEHAIEVTGDAPPAEVGARLAEVLDTLCKADVR